MKTGRLVFVIALAAIVISVPGIALAETSISVTVGGIWSSAYGGNPAYGTPSDSQFPLGRPNVTFFEPTEGCGYVPYGVYVPFPGDLHRSFDGTGPYGVGRRYDIYGWGP